MCEEHTSMDQRRGRLIGARTDSDTVQDGMVITLDQPLEQLASPDLLILRTPAGKDLELTLVNEPGQPPKVACSPMPAVNFECPLEHINDRQWRLRFEPHHKDILRGL